jgi:hypothetical protein
METSFLRLVKVTGIKNKKTLSSLRNRVIGAQVMATSLLRLTLFEYF